MIEIEKEAGSSRTFDSSHVPTDSARLLVENSANTNGCAGLPMYVYHLELPGLTGAHESTAVVCFKTCVPNEAQTRRS